MSNYSEAILKATKTSAFIQKPILVLMWSDGTFTEALPKASVQQYTGKPVACVEPDGTITEREFDIDLLVKGIA